MASPQKYMTPRSLGLIWMFFPGKGNLSSDFLLPAFSLVWTETGGSICSSGEQAFRI